MMKIIAGKKYNTETAIALGYYQSNCSYSDFRYFDETLYRKKTGEYFLHGTGGPMTIYSSSQGPNCYGWGADITPLTIREAKEWVEEHLSAEEYENIFGEVEE